MDPKLQALLAKRRTAELEADLDGSDNRTANSQKDANRSGVKAVAKAAGIEPSNQSKEANQKIPGMDPKLKALLAKRLSTTAAEDEEPDEKPSPGAPALASLAIDTRSVFLHIEAKSQAEPPPPPKPHDALSSMAIARRSHSAAGKDVDTRSLFDHISAAFADGDEEPAADAPAGARLTAILEGDEPVDPTAARAALIAGIRHASSARRQVGRHR